VRGIQHEIKEYRQQDVSRESERLKVQQEVRKGVKGWG